MVKPLLCQLRPVKLRRKLALWISYGLCSRERFDVNKIIELVRTSGALVGSFVDAVLKVLLLL
jgi:hypothetical protein